MKKVVFLLLCTSIFLLTSCTQKVAIDKKVVPLPTVSTYQDDITAFQYQGVIEISFPASGDIKKLIVPDPKFSESKNGTPLVFKDVGKYLTPTDIKDIKESLGKGLELQKISFEGNDLALKDKKITIKMQYLILDVSPDIKEVDIKRKLSFSLEGYNSKNKKVINQTEEITVP